MEIQQLSAENKRLLDNGKAMRTEWESFRDMHLKEPWDAYSKLEEGDHWDKIQLEEWQAPITINHVRKIKYWTISLLTDQPARLSMYGRGADDYEKPVIGQDEMGQPIKGLSRVERIDKLTRHLWDQLYIENRRMTCWDYALKYSVGWMKPFINLQKKFWTGQEWVPGDIDLAVIDPWYVGVDPSASWNANPIDVLDTAEYMIHYCPMSVRAAKRTYPHLAKEIDALEGAGAKNFSPWHFRSLDPTTGKVHDEFIPQANAAGTSTYTGGHKYNLKGTPEKIYDGKQVMLCETYMRDRDYGMVCLTTIEGLLLNVRGGGQHVHSDKVCDGGPYPFEHGEFPFLPYVCNPRAGRLYGYGLYDILQSPQLVLDKMWAQILDTQNLIKGPPIVVEEGSCQERKLTTAPNAKWIYAPGTQAPQYANIPTLPHDRMEMIQLAQHALTELGGISESIMAGTVKAGTPGIAVEGMIEQAMQRIRLLERYNYATNRRLGHQFISIMQQRYRYTGIEARIVGPEGDPQSMFLAPDDWKGTLDFEVIPSSALTLKKAEWFKKAMDLDATGRSMPVERFVEYGGFPDVQAVTNDIKQEMKVQERIQMLEQENEELKAQVGAPAPPPPGPGGM